MTEKYVKVITIKWYRHSFSGAIMLCVRMAAKSDFTFFKRIRRNLWERADIVQRKMRIFQLFSFFAQHCYQQESHLWITTQT